MPDAACQSRLRRVELAFHDTHSTVIGQRAGSGLGKLVSAPEGHDDGWRAMCISLNMEQKKDEIHSAQVGRR